MRDVTADPYPPFDGIEPYGTVRSVADERAHRKRMCALGYRIFGALRWGMLGDGHISARDPVFADHFWLLDWGVPFAEATVRQLCWSVRAAKCRASAPRRAATSRTASWRA